MLESAETEAKEINYNVLPTIKRFHESGAQIRCIVGPVGSGKTSGASVELCHFLPEFLFNRHGIDVTRWVIVRNTYRELIDTTQRTLFEWFPDGEYSAKDEVYYLPYKDYFVEILFRACDRPQDIKKFKSLELTGYWGDESIEIPMDVKRMLKTRIGRYPRMCPVRFGIETTNPPDVEDPTYSMFAWDTPPPGPVPTGKPLENHVGFWQPPGENETNLRPGYYVDLKTDYADNQDWVERYIEGKPGVTIIGKLVYANFQRDRHVAKEPLIWSQGKLYRGWDNSGNCPACVVAQIPTARHLQVLKEFHTDRQNIVDFTQQVVAECELSFPGAEYIDYGDPAGAHEFSKKEGGFTSNKKLMQESCGIDVVSSEQNFTARVESVDQAMGRYDGLLIDPQCIRLINGFLGGYCYPEIGTTGLYRSEPLKNRFSHPHDALQYLMAKVMPVIHKKDDRKRTPDRVKSERVQIVGKNARRDNRERRADYGFRS